MADDPREAWEAWRGARQAELGGPESWLGVVGLVWLEGDAATVGSGEACQVRLPAGPSRLGELLRQGDELRWRPAAAGLCRVERATGQEGCDFLLASDAGGQPSRVACGDLVFFVIERNGRAGVRILDLAWRQKRDFTGIDCYPYDPAWRIEAAWSELSPPLQLELPDVSGGLKSIQVSRRATFRIGGQDHSLLPIDVAGERVSFILRDATSGRETYGGGRFLQAELTGQGGILLDFNRCHNPPCAFTGFAACPLPPPENWLSVPIRAGEKKYSREEHG